MASKLNLEIFLVRGHCHRGRLADPGAEAGDHASMSRRDRQFRSRPTALAIARNSNAAEYGGRAYLFSGIQAGKFYRL